MGIGQWVFATNAKNKDSVSKSEFKAFTVITNERIFILNKNVEILTNTAKESAENVKELKGSIDIIKRIVIKRGY